MKKKSVKRAKEINDTVGSKNSITLLLHNVDCHKEGELQY